MFNPIVLNQVSLDWADGTPCLRDASAVFSSGLTGIVGDNGAGKSSLLRLITGELAPTSGTVSVTGPVGVLPQQLTLAVDSQIADLLGIRAVLDALHAIESGDVSAAHFEAVGDDWDVAARAQAELAAAGLPTDLDRRVGTLSGGEVMLTAIVGLHLKRHPITLLDEPTNNLDRPTRARLRDLLSGWRGTLLVVSHDAELLRLADQIEVRDGRLTSYGGNWDAYLEQLVTERESARRQLAGAEQRLRTEQRKRAEAQQRQAHREQFASSALPAASGSLSRTTSPTARRCRPGGVSRPSNSLTRRVRRSMPRRDWCVRTTQ